jgi:hypothetical protein
LGTLALAWLTLAWLTLGGVPLSRMAGSQLGGRRGAAAAQSLGLLPARAYDGTLFGARLAHRTPALGITGHDLSSP